MCWLEDASVVAAACELLLLTAVVVVVVAVVAAVERLVSFNGFVCLGLNESKMFKFRRCLLV